MNAKTEQQIQRMKQQTIGVEIEMNHITRERGGPNNFPPPISARADANILPAETDTALGRHGMHRAENGSFNGTTPSPA